MEIYCPQTIVFYVSLSTILLNNLVELSSIIKREVYQTERLVFRGWGLDVLYRQWTAPYSYSNNTAVAVVDECVQ